MSANTYVRACILANLTQRGFRLPIFNIFNKQVKLHACLVSLHVNSLYLHKYIYAYVPVSKACFYGPTGYECV